MKHEFQIGDVILPIYGPKNVKYFIVNTQPGAYAMCGLSGEYLVAAAPMLQIDKDYVKIGKYVSGVGEVSDDE